MEERIESMSWFTYNCIPRTDKNWKKVWDSVSGQQQVIAGMLESGADFVGTQEAAAVAWALPPTGVPSGRNYPEQPINLEEAGGEAGWGWTNPIKAETGKASCRYHYGQRQCHWGVSILFNKTRGWRLKEEVPNATGCVGIQVARKESIDSRPMCWGLYEKEGYKESVVVFCCHLPHVGMCRTYKSEGGFCWQCSDCSLVQKLRASLSKAIADALSLMEPKPSSLILMGDFNELGEYIGGKFNSKKEWNRGQSFKVAGRFNLYSGERSDDGLFRLPTGYTTWNRRRISHPDRTFFGSIEEDFDLKTDVFRIDIKASDHFAVPCSMWRKR